MIVIRIAITPSLNARDNLQAVKLQGYAGTASPIIFNGLVRQYDLRADAEQGDLQVNFVPKGERRRASHDLAIEVRKLLSTLPRPDRTVLRVVEIPTGPRTGICLDATRAALAQNDVKVLMLMPSFQNPLGSCMPDANKEKLYQVKIVLCG